MTRTASVVVVGGGHAGCEAAAAAARMGCEVALVTLSRQAMALMPCNPAVGGIGKGHLVVELDALGGLQGWAADRSGIQFKLLNASRGPAVWGPRAQCDKQRYADAMRRAVLGMPRVRVVEGEVKGLLADRGRVRGVRLADGEQLRADTVVLATGTFLEGVLHVGETRGPGGRLGEPPSSGLSAELRALGLRLKRFKTGTPPRLHRDSVDRGRLELQAGDEVPLPFSWRTRRVANRAHCFVARTPAALRTIVLDNLDRSPLYTGRIVGVGPRYCPSIEDKVVRFPHHEEHTLFLEPEGLYSPSLYVNGLSTSLPADVQEQMVHVVPGLERARFLRYGYAVEYDVVVARQVDAELRAREVAGLFLAGQLLGTSGYEEAAVLGFLAGVNAACDAQQNPGLVLRRHHAYAGVLVDDLVGREREEPYRMFTSRAEHRLLLGVDSARERLMEVGVRLGLVPERVFHVERGRWERRHQARCELESERLNPTAATQEVVRKVAGVVPRCPCSWADLLRRQDVDAERVAALLPPLRELPVADRRAVVASLRYQGYLERAEREWARLERLRDLAIPRDLDYAAIGGLSREAVEALNRHRPQSLAEAERLAGVTPAAMAILAAHVAAKGKGGRGA